MNKLKKVNYQEDTKKSLKAWAPVVTLNPDIGKFLQAERKFWSYVGRYNENSNKIYGELEAEFNTKRIILHKVDFSLNIILE